MIQELKNDHKAGVHYQENSCIKSLSINNLSSLKDILLRYYLLQLCIKNYHFHQSIFNSI